MEEKKENILSLLGIDIKDEKIDIDLKQTKNFFQNLQKTLEQKSKDINKNIKEGKLDLSDSVGIKVDDEHISLDLNKTKSFFENLTQKIEQFTKDLDKSVNDLTNKNKSQEPRA